MKNIILLIGLTIFCGCNKQKDNLNNYIVTYKIYYPNNVTIKKFKCEQCKIYLFSRTGTNFIGYDKKYTGSHTVFSSTAEIEIVDKQVLKLEK